MHLTYRCNTVVAKWHTRLFAWLVDYRTTMEKSLHREKILYELNIDPCAIVEEFRAKWFQFSDPSCTH
jgi:hypothetical protein